jgi:diacylglycerol kinase (ATP)
VRRKKKPQDSFRYATEGLMHCFRTQRHMQIHFVLMILVLLSALMVGMDKRDVILLLVCIVLVISAEMVNTAIETVVDMVTQQYHPLAKLAKDVAAGAVMVCSLNAVIVGLLLFLDNKNIQKIQVGVRFQSPDVTIVVVVGILVLSVTVIMSKLVTGRSNAGIWHGGVVSGHSAIGFFLAMTILFSSGNTFVAVLALLMALIIAQSRVEAGVHSIQEVVLGAAVAIFLTTSVYYFMPVVRGLLLERYGGTHAFMRDEEKTSFAVKSNTVVGSRLRS